MSLVALRSLRRCAPVSALALAALPAQAAFMIEYTGMNLVYDGSAIYDAGSTSGGVGDPADADSLQSVDFFEDGVHIGSLDADVWLDVYIPDVSGLVAGVNSVSNITTPGNPGFFDLLIGTSPLASEFLIVDLDSVTIVYSDIAGFAHLVFGGAVADTYAQNLPFGVDLTGPVTLSFSMQLQNVTTAGGFLTGFNSFGTGEFTAVPAPGAALLLAGLAAPALRRRR
jgi:hypothetical protein